MKHLPFVSIIIPVKNPGKIIRKVLTEVYNQSYDGEFEVILVDSGSNDGTLEFFNDFQKTHPNLYIISIPPTEFGHGKTRNFAISKSKGELIAVITHDATPASNLWLENLVTPFLKNPNVAGVFGRHLPYEDADIFMKRELTLHFDGFNQTPPISYYSFNNNPEIVSNRSLQMFYYFFSDNNAMLRKSVWEKIPYEDVNFAEDQKWAKAILEAGYVKAYSDEAAVFHSHTYSIIEIFRRCFEEAVSFQDHFQYRVIENILLAIKLAIYKSLTDAKVTVVENNMSMLRKLNLLISRPIYNTAKYFGYYLGSMTTNQSHLYNVISIDRRLFKKGLGRNKKNV